MKWKTISLTDKEGLELFCGPFNELPIQEDFILKKSMELFHEPEPCIIYRTQITRKFYLELLEILTGPLSPDARFLWHTLQWYGRMRTCRI